MAQRFRTVLRTQATRVRRAAAPWRLMMAAKTALAVGIAWPVGHAMPWNVDDFPYYAPLGALISVYPSLMSSAESAAQSLAGLAFGLVLALAVVITVGPTWWSISLVVGVGVLFTGTGWFGVGRDYVPMAALLVLIIGGSNAEDYSLGYLVQMLAGVVIGLTVNFVIAPPTGATNARAQIDHLRERLAQQLRDIGEALAESWPPEQQTWAENTADLMALAGETRESLTIADDGRKANPRALILRTRLRGDYLHLDRLVRLAHQTREISEMLASAVWRGNSSMRLDASLAAPISVACKAVAAAIEQQNNVLQRDDTGQAHGAVADAASAVRHLVEAVNDRNLQSGQTTGPAVMVTMHLRRMLDLLHSDRADA